MSETLEQLREAYEQAAIEYNDPGWFGSECKHAAYRDAHSAYLVAVIKAERAKIWEAVEPMLGEVTSEASEAKYQESLGLDAMASHHMDNVNACRAAIRLAIEGATP